MNYCRCCGDTLDHEEGECLEDDDIQDMIWDGTVDTFCPECGSGRTVEPDARNYPCWVEDCNGKITSPLEIILF